MGKYNVDKLREILKKYRGYDILEHHGLGIKGELEDDEIVTRLVELGEKNLALLLNLHNDVYDVSNELSSRLLELDKKAFDIASKLDEEQRDIGKTSDLLKKELEDTMRERVEKEREAEHVDMFVFHIKVARSELSKRRRRV